MRSCNRTYTIKEYGGFTRGAAADEYQGLPYQGLPERTFDALEAFILANNTDLGTDAIELLSLSARRGLGKMITARNYVGLITMTDGTVIEILPKIAGTDIKESETRRIFLEMLKTLKDVTFKDFNVSHLHTDRLSLLEIFIKMFLDEVSILIKQGLKAAYIPVEANERFYKGKLLASQNIKYNLVSKERFFVRYDDFSINRPENRLIKSTLRLLLETTGDRRNHQNAARLLTFFEKVAYSANHEADFSKCFADRSTNHYNRALSWCRVFLRRNSFTAFAGSEVAFALLFPMDKVFESFVAAKFRKLIGGRVNMRIQDSRYNLFDSPARAFALRPDIVMEFAGHTVVLDTKWKLLSDNTRNSGISQSDMYQMYVYSKKYDADRIFLLYPSSNAFSKADIRFSSDDHVQVNVSFVDLTDIDRSMTELLTQVVPTIIK
jgi:McrBC 5-methylcytosine restriction system component